MGRSDSEQSDSDHHHKRHKRKKHQHRKHHSKHSKEDKLGRIVRKCSDYVGKHIEIAAAAAEQAASGALVPGKTEVCIAESDYFRKIVEFKAWIARKKGVYFDQFTSQQTRQLFGEFVVRWNMGKMSDEEYGATREGLRETIGYQWKFKSLDAGEQAELSQVRRSVHSKTYQKKSKKREEVAFKSSFRSSMEERAARALEEAAQRSEREQGKPVTIAGKVVSEAEHVLEREEERKRLKFERKRLREQDTLVQEELVPKKDPGFAERLDQRRTQNAYRRQPTAKEADVDIDVFGSDDRSFRASVKKRAVWKERKQERRDQERRERIAQAQRKEAEKMTNFRKMMGL